MADKDTIYFVINNNEGDIILENNLLPPIGWKAKIDDEGFKINVADENDIDNDNNENEDIALNTALVKIGQKLSKIKYIENNDYIDISCNNLDISGVLNVDIINEKTLGNGVVIEGITLKNATLNVGSNSTVTASNFNVGNKNVISASAQISCIDLEVKNNGNVGVLANGQTGDMDLTGTLSVNEINEKTLGNGVVIEGITLKADSINCGSNELICGSISSNGNIDCSAINSISLDFINGISCGGINVINSSGHWIGPSGNQGVLESKIVELESQIQSILARLDTLEGN